EPQAGELLREAERRAGGAARVDQPVLGVRDEQRDVPGRAERLGEGQGERGGAGRPGRGAGQRGTRRSATELTHTRSLLPGRAAARRGSIAMARPPRLPLACVRPSVRYRSHPPAEPPPMATILIIDDEPGVRDALTRILTGDGHRVLEAGNGAEARTLVADGEGTSVDLVLTDIFMPEMDG